MNPYGIAGTSIASLPLTPAVTAGAVIKLFQKSILGAGLYNGTFNIMIIFTLGVFI
jgi:hypothetical protein